jgi:hypothetical protein
MNSGFRKRFESELVSIEYIVLAPIGNIILDGDVLIHEKIWRACSVKGFNPMNIANIK